MNEYTFLVEEGSYADKWLVGCIRECHPGISHYSVVKKEKEMPKFDIRKPMRTKEGKKKAILVYDNFYCVNSPESKFLVVIKGHFNDLNDASVIFTESSTPDIETFSNEWELENIPEDEMEEENV